MPFSTSAYFKSLQEFLNLRHYGVGGKAHDKLTLKERPDLNNQKKEQVVTLGFQGEAFAIKLDKEERKGVFLPLFHFLRDEAQPWARRCDFVVFHYHQNKIQVSCIEFKSGKLPELLPEQLKSSVAWCKSLQSTIKHYTTLHETLYVAKYVFSELNNMAQLNETGEYVKRDPTIRHYFYKDINGKNLENLENHYIDEIK